MVFFILFIKDERENNESNKNVPDYFLWYKVVVIFYKSYLSNSIIKLFNIIHFEILIIQRFNFDISKLEFNFIYSSSFKDSKFILFMSFKRYFFIFMMFFIKNIKLITNYKIYLNYIYNNWNLLFI